MQNQGFVGAQTAGSYNPMMQQQGNYPSADGPYPMNQGPYNGDNQYYESEPAGFDQLVSNTEGGQSMGQPMGQYNPPPLSAPMPLNSQKKDSFCFLL
jgi:hypothetical protein